jgi:hypothetical protein
MRWDIGTEAGVCHIGVGEETHRAEDNILIETPERQPGYSAGDACRSARANGRLAEV